MWAPEDTRSPGITELNRQLPVARFRYWAVNFGLCGDLHRNGPLRLMHLNAWPMGCGTVKRRGLAGLGVASEEVCHCGVMLKLCPVWRAVPFCCLWIKMQNSQLLQHHAFLHAAMLPAMTVTDRPSELSQPHVNVCLCKSCCGPGVSSQQ